MFYGHLLLPKAVPEGNYTLRAYTRYMENLGDDYFFKKNIRIGNVGSNENSANPKHLAGNPGSDYDISFFPGGGKKILSAMPECRRS